MSIHTVHVKVDVGSLAHGHSWIGCHTGEVGATVCVDGGDGQVAPGRDPLPVWQHFLVNKERRVVKEDAEDKTGITGKTKMSLVREALEEKEKINKEQKKMKTHPEGHRVRRKVEFKHRHYLKMYVLLLYNSDI